jgi:hypothetical protein
MAHGSSNISQAGRSDPSLLEVKPSAPNQPSRGHGIAAGFRRTVEDDGAAKTIATARTSPQAASQADRGKHFSVTGGKAFQLIVDALSA